MAQERPLRPRRCERSCYEGLLRDKGEVQLKFWTSLRCGPFWDQFVEGVRALIRFKPSRIGIINGWFGVRPGR